MINLLLVDDHQLVREGIKNILSQTEDIVVMAEAENGKEAVRLALELNPDLILMDVQMPVCDGITAVGLIKKELPEMRIAMLTVVDTDRSLFQALKSGADGYLLKNMSSAQYINAIRAIMQGEISISPPLASKILRSFVQEIQGEKEDVGPMESLSEREKEVLELISQGLTYSQVAKELFIAENTVKNHVHNAIRKLHVRNRIQAITVFQEAIKRQ